MHDDELLEIAGTWSFWDRPPPRSIPRTVELPASLSNRTVLVIQGVRRCGKSTLLAQLIARYRLDRNDCLFVNFEDPRLAGCLGYETLERLANAFGERRSGAETLTVLLDEIQSVDGWEKWLRTKLERPGRLQFVVSGSNSRLLSGEPSSVLTGRHITVQLFPFDVSEFRLAHPGATVRDYLDRGGFPEPVARDDGDLLLRQYFMDIVQRDVRERVGARSSLALRQIVQMVFESAGSELSLRRIAAASGIPFGVGVPLAPVVAQLCRWRSRNGRRSSFNQMVEHGFGSAYGRIPFGVGVPLAPVVAQLCRWRSRNGRRSSFNQMVEHGFGQRIHSTRWLNKTSILSFTR